MASALHRPRASAVTRTQPLLWASHSSGARTYGLAKGLSKPRGTLEGRGQPMGRRRPWDWGAACEAWGWPACVQATVRSGGAPACGWEAEAWGAGPPLRAAGRSWGNRLEVTEVSQARPPRPLPLGIQEAMVGSEWEGWELNRGQDAVATSLLPCLQLSVSLFLSLSLSFYLCLSLSLSLCLSPSLSLSLHLCLSSPCLSVSLSLSLCLCAVASTQATCLSQEADVPKC